MGSKAATLSALASRFPVPAGFVITATRPSADGAMPDEVTAALAAAYTLLARRLGSPAPPVAVRSSGVEEDGREGSFAGQYASYLNVAGLPAVTEAVGRCLASAWSEKARAYRASRGLTGEPRLAVLVQQFLPADAAGVAFSLHPVTGERSEVLIHAVWGLGESLAGGSAAADEYRVAKRRLAVLESRAAEKLRMAVAVPGGTAEVMVPRFLRHEPVLTEEQATEVAGLAIALEEEMGCPVDLEFAYAEGRLWLLQCRPITGLEAAAEPARAASIPVEVPPEFPVTWAAAEDAAKYWAHNPGSWPDQILPLFGSFFGPWSVAFMRENPALFCEFRRINTYLFERFEPNPDAPPAAEIPFVTAAQLQSLWEWEILPEIQVHCLQLASTDLASLPQHALPPQLDEVVNRYIQIWELHWRIVNPVLAALRQFQELYRELFPADEAHGGLRLLRGFENKSLESNRGLWQLSRKVLADPRVLAIFQESPPAEILVRLRAGEAGGEWLAELQGWLERYGRRFELWDWTRPSWLEEPVPAVQAVQTFLRRPDHNPDAVTGEVAAERQQLADELRRRLAGYPLPVRERFDLALEAAQVANLLKEEHHFWIDHRCMYEVRRALLTMGHRLVGAGLMDEASDLWYLTLEEIREVAAGSAPPLRPLIAERRQEMARWAAAAPPPRLGRRPLREAAAGPEAEPNLLRGEPCSPGVGRGRARVVHNLAEAVLLQPGEVLVAPTLTPSWTPLFAIAAAVVTEGGDLLSHGAILAREYRLPAVLGVAGATRTIRDGQFLRVDGGTGVVKLV